MQEGLAGCPDDAQHPAVPGMRIRDPARRLHGGERQSALHAARARAPAEGFRCGSDRDRRELRAHAAGSDRQDAGSPHHRHVDRRIAEVQGHRRRFRAPPHQEDDPGVVAAGIDPSLRRACGGPAPVAATRPRWPRRHRVPAVHGRNDGRRQGGDAAEPEHGRQPVAGAGLGEALPRSESARGGHHAAAALSHLFADGELPHVHDARCARTC